MCARTRPSRSEQEQPHLPPSERNFGKRFLERAVPMCNPPIRCRLRCGHMFWFGPYGILSFHNVVFTTNARQKLWRQKSAKKIGKNRSSVHPTKKVRNVCIGRSSRTDRSSACSPLIKCGTSVLTVLTFFPILLYTFCMVNIII